MLTRRTNSANMKNSSAIVNRRPMYDITIIVKMTPTNSQQTIIRLLLDNWFQSHDPSTALRVNNKYAKRGPGPKIVCFPTQNVQ